MACNIFPNNVPFGIFKKMAETNPNLNKDCVYELECIVVESNPSYPRFKVGSLFAPFSTLLFRTFEDAEARMKEIVAESHQNIYSFHINQFPFGTPVYRNYPEVSWLYGPDGTLLDWQTLPLVSFKEESEDTHFELFEYAYCGRPKERIRFRKGDIVEVHDPCNDYNEVYLAVVLAPEADVDYCWKHYRECVDNGSSYDLSGVRDFSVLIGLSSDPDDFGQVRPLDLMKPRFPISDEIREMFMQNFKKDE